MFDLSLQQSATSRMLQFSSRQQPRLSKANFANTGIHAFNQRVHQPIRAEAFDRPRWRLLWMRNLSTVLRPRQSLLFIQYQWTGMWQPFEALEELYPMRAEHRHLTVGYRWESVVNESRSTVEIQSGNMVQVHQLTLVKWSRGLVNIGPVPENRRYKTVGRTL